MIWWHSWDLFNIPFRHVLYEAIGHCGEDQFPVLYNPRVKYKLPAVTVRGELHMSRILIDALSHAKNKIVTPKKIGKGRVSKKHNGNIHHWVVSSSLLALLSTLKHRTWSLSCISHSYHQPWIVKLRLFLMLFLRLSLALSGSLRLSQSLSGSLRLTQTLPGSYVT